MADDWFDRRTFLKYSSATGASVAGMSLAGCVGGDGDDDDDGDADSDGGGGDGGSGDGGSGDGGDSDGSDGGDGDDGDYVEDQEQWQDLDEPETREGYLQRANLAAHQEAPWIFLNRQYSNYGKSADLDWEPRSDELIKGAEMSGSSEVVVTQGNMDSGLDPHDHRETPTTNIALQAYDRLLDRDAEGSVQAGLAEDWERIEDGHVRFHLRDGVTFHNGDELQPEDVAYSVNRVVDSDTGGLASPQNDQLAGVTGAEVVDGENAVDVFSDGLNPIVFSLFASYCDIVQRDWFESRDSGEINRSMNGTGPFQLSDYEPDVEVVFEPYEGHWNGAPDVDTLTFRAASEDSTRVNQLIQGETDVIVNVPPQEVSRVQNEDSTEMAAVPSTRVIYNGMRYDSEPFDSVEFRRALNYAIDLETIVDDTLQGFADQTGQPTLEGFVGYNEDIDPYPYDPERADELIEEAGYEGAEITLHTPVGRYLQDLEIAQATAGYIDDLDNVSASVQQREFGSLAGELTDGDITTGPDWYLIGWGNEVFDATQTIIPLLTSDGALTSYQNEEFDRLLEEAQNLPGSQ